MHRAIIRQVLGQMGPLAAAAQPKQDRLLGPPGVDARASGRLGRIKRGDDRADAGPEGVGDLPDGGQVFGPRRRFAPPRHAGLQSTPHRAFEIVSKSLVPLIDERHTVIDLCSVKVYPARLMQRYLTKS